MSFVLIEGFVLNRVRVLNPQRLTYTKILIKYPPGFITTYPASRNHFLKLTHNAVMLLKNRGGEGRGWGSGKGPERRSLSPIAISTKKSNGNKIERWGTRSGRKKGSTRK